MPALDYAPPAKSPTDLVAEIEARELALDRKLCEKSFFYFCTQAWPHIEPVEFRDGWHIRACCQVLQEVTEGKRKNVLVNLPPRHMKSRIFSILWQAWEWTTSPGQQYLCVTYDADLTNDLSTKSRDLIKSDWYQKRWGHRFRLKEDQDAKSHYANDQMGTRVSVTVRGGAVGKGGSRILVDDPHNTKRVESESERNEVIHWWGNVLKTRRNNPDAPIVVIMQRCHEEDLAGYILANEGERWDWLCFPARYEPGLELHGKRPLPLDRRTQAGEPLWPEMYPAPVLDELTRDLDPYAVAGQYQQRPVSRQGGMIDVSWFKVVEAWPASLLRVRAWDLASTEGGGDETAGGIVAEDEQGRVYIGDVVDGRWAPAEVEQVLAQTARLDGPGVPIVLPQDPGQAGKAQTVNLVTRVLRGYDVRFRRPTGSKAVRAAPWVSQARLGNVHLVRGPWVKKFLDQCRMFPRGKHDDLIDFVSDGFAELVEHGGGGGAGLSPEDYARAGVKGAADDLLLSVSQRQTTRRAGAGMRWRKP